MQISNLLTEDFMANAIGNKLKFELLSGNLDFDANAFKVALMGAGFVFDVDAHQNWSDVSAAELAAGNGYAAGGQALAGVAVTQDNANDRARVTWSNPSWNAVAGAIGPSSGAIIYKNTGVPGTSTIVGYLDFGGNQTAQNGAPFTILNPVVQIV
jgi:hypothetical protein